MSTDLPGFLEFTVREIKRLEAIDEERRNKIFPDMARMEWDPNPKLKYVKRFYYDSEDNELGFAFLDHVLVTETIAVKDIDPHDNCFYNKYSKEDMRHVIWDGFSDRSIDSDGHTLGFSEQSKLNDYCVAKHWGDIPGGVLNHIITLKFLVPHYYRTVSRLSKP